MWHVFHETVKMLCKYLCRDFYVNLYIFHSHLALSPNISRCAYFSFFAALFCSVIICLFVCSVVCVAAAGLLLLGLWFLDLVGSPFPLGACEFKQCGSDNNDKVTF